MSLVIFKISKKSIIIIYQIFEIEILQAYSIYTCILSFNLFSNKKFSLLMIMQHKNKKLQEEKYPISKL